MSIKDVKNSMTLDIIEWWKRIYVADLRLAYWGSIADSKILGLRLDCGCCIVIKKLLSFF